MTNGQLFKANSLLKNDVLKYEQCQCMLFKFTASFKIMFSNNCIINSFLTHHQLDNISHQFNLILLQILFLLAFSNELWQLFSILFTLEA